jgi:dGTPase
MNDLKDFLLERVYLGTSVAKREERKVSGLIEGLFGHYMTRAESLPGHPRLGELSATERARLVTDYIAGMTDRFANDRYVELFLPRGWGTR